MTQTELIGAATVALLGSLDHRRADAVRAALADAVQGDAGRRINADEDAAAARLLQAMLAALPVPPSFLDNGHGVGSPCWPTTAGQDAPSLHAPF